MGSSFWGFGVLGFRNSKIDALLCIEFIQIWAPKKIRVPSFCHLSLPVKVSSLGFFRDCCFGCHQSDHEEGSDVLSKKTKNFIAASAAAYDADFYVKVDDDVYINLGALL